MNPLQANAVQPIVRQLGFPGDSNTYYVQVVVRNSLTNAIVATVNLTDRGEQRFTGTFTTPADTQGTGYNLDMTTTVYTDPDYETLSDLYTIEQDAYLVMDRSVWTRGSGGGVWGGSGEKIDYKKIEKILEEKVQEGIAKLKIPEYTAPDYTPLYSAITESKNRLEASIGQATDEVKTHVTDENKSISASEKRVIAALDALPKFQETDLQGISNSLRGLHTILREVQQKDVTSPILEAIKKEVGTLLEAIDAKHEDEEARRSAIEKFVEAIGGIKAEKKEPGEKEASIPTPPDYLKTASSLLEN